ncbi:hypothetical protein GCM10011321_25670 [Youhaiella tibetensis]|uniref:Uncharacterized protein n=1 Tax=Paradevosia tibetensis TaxID=1447062 RepID=A0A5B9DL83_9HYPH|nr:hypothetical protein [Youhaiella tibetensis]QEE19419.1 hypothetical protein FNA67_04175 [Youhaiella tibetensis]GGF33371.1 hypothetical protein GCM10011321_25670 [Youhaiella tibetensis]
MQQDDEDIDDLVLTELDLNEAMKEDAETWDEGEKALLIKHIFDDLWIEETNSLKKTIIIDEDLRTARVELGKLIPLKIKVGNPNNFFKDIVRKKAAYRLWPASLRDKGWTGEQRTGDGKVFEFVRITEEWPDNLQIDYGPTEDTPRFIVQTLSIPLWTKELGRNDEPWLLQSAVNLRVVETHFSTAEKSQLPALSVTHLQMDLKLRKTQIDALYLLQYDQGAARPSGFAHVTVEAKQHNQRIVVEQVGWQAEAALKNQKADYVVPLALAAVRGEGIYVVEFEMIKRGDEVPPRLKVFRDALYLLRPKLVGI